MADPRKPIFDAVRAAKPGVFNEPGNAVALDNLLDAFGVGRAEIGRRRIGPAGLDLIKRFEGCKLKAYKCPAGVWTIGWGATGKDIVEGLVWTQAQADARLAKDLERYAFEVDTVLGRAPTTQNQFDALVSFHYNTGKIGSATLTAKHKRGDHDGAAREFGKWVMAGGRKRNGLVNRRAAERELYAG